MISTICPDKQKNNLDE